MVYLFSKIINLLESLIISDSQNQSDEKENS